MRVSAEISVYLALRQLTTNTGHESRLSQIISGIDQDDATEAYQVEGEDNKISSSPNSSTSSVNTPPSKIISWEDGDPENPYNWSFVRYISQSLPN